MNNHCPPLSALLSSPINSKTELIIKKVQLSSYVLIIQKIQELVEMRSQESRRIPSRHLLSRFIWPIPAFVATSPQTGSSAILLARTENRFPSSAFEPKAAFTQPTIAASAETTYAADR
jgi:hypothetical protein